MIWLREISKTYRNYENETHALKKVSFAIEQGEMLAITGTSGSGKSTLLHILGGLDLPTSGEYFYDDQKVSQMNARELHFFRQENVGFVFQDFSLIGRYTAYENMELPLIARGVKGRREIVMDCMKRLGIEGLAGKRPAHLSGGQQQRVAIGRALVSDTPMLLCDEPTGALDEKTSEEVMDLLCEINREGKTVIVVTHDLKIAERCRRQMRMEDGKIYEIG